MSRPTFINSTVVYHDNSTEYNIDARGNKDIASILRACQAEDVEPVQEEKPASAPAAPTEAEVWKKPKKGKYSEVRRYIEERKRGDVEFREYCAKHSLRELCTRLTEEFGWFVDEHSLGANLNRHI